MPVSLVPRAVSGSSHARWPGSAPLTDEETGLAEVLSVDHRRGGEVDVGFPPGSQVPGRGPRGQGPPPATPHPPPSCLPVGQTLAGAG